MNKKIFDFEFVYMYLYDCIKWWKEIEEKKIYVKLIILKVFYLVIWNELRYLINCFLV